MSTDKNPKSPPEIGKDIRVYFHYLFDLEEDQASARSTIEEIKKGIPFRGTNLWILMFAIMVCSIGLNVNSTAVIIGAMLISPIMGPIMGVGMGVAINSFEMIVNSLKNLSVAMVISVLVSCLYFLISPELDDQSELLARTSPTLWDVMIAFFGGLAGIVASSRTEKSNAIPGVAIATALMPPLCTAGFGLATGQWEYFLGALYLFIINCVFISFSTFLIVRFLRFPKKDFIDPVREAKVKRYIACFVLLTMIPSVYTAFRVVNKSVYERNANQFVNKELKFEGTTIIQRSIEYHKHNDSSFIDVIFLGNLVEPEQIEKAVSKMPDYELFKTKLTYYQRGLSEIPSDDMLAKVNEVESKLRSEFIQNIYNQNEKDIKDKNEKIKYLEEQLFKAENNALSNKLPVKQIFTEIKAIDKNVTELSITPTIVSSLDNDVKLDTVHLAYLNFERKPGRNEVKKLTEWLKVRINSDKLKVVSGK